MGVLHLHVDVVPRTRFDAEAPHETQLPRPGTSVAGDVGRCRPIGGGHVGVVSVVRVQRILTRKHARGRAEGRIEAVLPDVRTAKGPTVVRVLKVPKRAIRKNAEGAAVDVDAIVDRTRRVKVRSTTQVCTGASPERCGLEGQIHASDGTPVIHVHLDPIVKATVSPTDDDGGRFTKARERRRFRQGGGRSRSPRHRGHEEDKEDRDKASAVGHASPPSSSPLNASD